MDQNHDANSHHSEEEVNRGLSAVSIRSPHMVIVICLTITILGILSLITLPKDLLPSANMPAVQILSFYTGMPVDHVEQDLTYMFERYTGQAVGIERQESRSLTGVSIVKNFFNPSIDLSSAIAQTSSMVMSVLRKLPPGTQPPLILPFDPMASVPLAMVAVGGENKSQSQLQDMARYWVQNAVQGVPGAMAPTVMGGKARQAIVYLDPKKLRSFNLSPVQVMQKLNEMNTFIPAGDIRVGKLDYQIVSNGLVEDLKDIDSFALRSQNGTTVKLGQVGHAEDSNAIQTNLVLIDGQPEVYVPVYRQPGANSLEIVDQVRAAIARLGKSMSGFKMSVVSDQSIFIRKAIESITHEALIGGGFAAIMVLLFLGSFRATVAVLLSLPLSLVGAFVCLKLTGQTLNVMTLGGLALSVGVLVDNAIVVIEVIMQKRQRGMSARAASFHGAKEVAMPVLASTISTLIVFFPVVFLKGVVKILFSALSVAVISAMIASYFAAMMVIPLFTAYYLKEGAAANSGFLGVIQRWVERVTERYGRSLAWVVDHRKVVLPVALISLITIGALFVGQIGTELFPRADVGGFRLDLRGPTGSRLEETAKLAKEIEAKIHEYIPAHDLKMIITNAGVYYGYSAAFTPNSGTQDVFFNVELTEDREQTSQHYAAILRDRLHKDFPQVEFGIELGGLLTSALNGGLLSPIDVQVSGPKHEISYATAVKLAEQFKTIPGAVDVRIQQRFDAPEVKLEIDRGRASAVGITPDEIVKNVVSSVANSATYNPAIWIDPKTGIDYLFGVQFPDNTISNFDDLMNIPITSATQNRSVPLNWLAKASKMSGPIELNHVNLQPVIDIYMDAQGRDIGGVARDTQKWIDKMKLPEGYLAEVRGEVSSMNEAVGSLGGGFLLAAFLVYMILVVQFRSFLLPGIIMTTVPMGMVGVILILALTKTYFSIQAAIGCIFVIGVAVSHGVLLVEYILERSKIDATVDEAIIKGAMARLRPIAMTSLASILGLLPMAFGMGQGAEANIPLGRAVIGGQILSTLLNFYLVPALFRMFYGSIKTQPQASVIENIKSEEAPV
jgi:multidrug efflux pump subunit AcrB